MKSCDRKHPADIQIEDNEAEPSPYSKLKIKRAAM
jgi:hypothetical protein